MVDLHWSDSTKAPNDPDQNDWIVLTNEQWEEVKTYIEQMKERPMTYKEALGILDGLIENNTDEDESEALIMAHNLMKEKAEESEQCS